MDHPTLLPSIPPPRSVELREQTNQLLCKIIRQNSNTQFAQAASELSEFRRAIADLVDGQDNDILSDTFRKTVQLTTYDAYAPLIARFREKPCKASDIVNLLAPGLPRYIAQSTATSGGASKRFPVYNSLSGSQSSNSGSSLTSNLPRGRTRADMRCLTYRQIDVENEDNCPVKPIYILDASGAFRRMKWDLDPEKDEERMGTFIRDHTAPYAAAFVRNYQSFLLIHALFAIANRSLEAVTVVFITSFVDMMRLVDTEFDMIVDCIEHGTIPHLKGVDGVRHYLEANLSPDPERAVELRTLGRPSSCPGWCSHIWLKLHSIEGIASGAFASSIPLAQSYLGPNTHICPVGYGCSEASMIGLPYNARELNQFKLTKQTIIEFLDIGKDNDSISAIAQPWEVVVGGRYEILLTTLNGIWRYRLGDVVEVAGFDPSDGAPIVQFVERRNVILRSPDFMITEEELRAAMSSMSEKCLTYIVDWTATMDERRIPRTIRFFVELSTDQVSDLFLDAPKHIVESLSRTNRNAGWAFDHQTCGKPIIWVVKPGTFRDFRQMKQDEGSNSVQVKVPVVLPNDKYMTWLSSRVVREL